MKKHIIILLCVMNNINGMEEQQIIKREPREWNAQEYDNGNELQTTTFLNFIKENNINIKKNRILSAGCGTFKAESILAEQAEHIHGFDASKNMIDYAQNKYEHKKNISLEHCFAEDFQSQKLYDLALASFSIHWFDNKKQALQRINNSLKLHGELFGTITTSDNPKPVNLVVFLEMLSSLDWLCKFFTGKTLENLTGVTLISHQELETMLQETDFEIIKCKEQTSEYTFANMDALKKLYWPLVSSRPGMQFVPNVLIESLFNNFITRIAEKLKKNEDGSFTETLYTTIIHARKIQK
jgi:ubiquinone/menaquinone biosynthesis C-methylase UbiE